VVSRPRAVVLVGGPAAPYSRALRLGRALAADGYAVEIAAVAAKGLPAVETVSGPAPGSAGAPEPAPGAVGPIVLRRYRPSGLWATIGRTEAMRSTEAGADPSGRRRAGLWRDVLGPIFAIRRWLFWPHTVRGWWRTLERELAPADVYHACGALAIAPALAARERAELPAGRRPRVIHDAIDHASAGNEAQRFPGPIRRIVARRERGWARAADAIVTVNEALVDSLTAAWTPARPILAVPNAPEPPDPSVIDEPEPLLRHATGLADTIRIVLYQGRLGPDLGLENAAEAVLLVPDAALVVLGFGRGLPESLARDADPRFAGRHLTLPPRHPDELLRWTASADVSIIAAPPVSPNQRLSSATKFWESMAAGTPLVVVRGLETMARILEEHDLGAVATTDAPSDLATAIEAVLDRLERDGLAWRRAIATVGRDVFGWPAMATAYRALVRSLVDESPSRVDRTMGAPLNDGGSASQST